MNSGLNRHNTTRSMGRGRRAIVIAARLSLICIFCATTIAARSAGVFAIDPYAEDHRDARELYNAGTVKLKEGKYREAQDLFRAAAMREDDDVTGQALFNLGHAAFSMGEHDLKEVMKNRSRFQELPRRASMNAEEAAKAAQAALASDDVNALVQAYRRGAGARREMRAAREAVRQALEQFGRILKTWQRAAGNFRSVHELDPSDTEAKRNAELIDDRIAALIDMIRQQQQALATPSQAGQQLRDAMQEIKGRLPQELRDQLGEDGDEDEESDNGDGEKEESEERRGQGRPDQTITTEQAVQLLKSIQLDSERTLPPTPAGPTKQPQRPGGDW